MFAKKQYGHQETKNSMLISNPLQNYKKVQTKSYRPKPLAHSNKSQKLASLFVGYFFRMNCRFVILNFIKRVKNHGTLILL